MTTEETSSTPYPAVRTLVSLAEVAKRAVSRAVDDPAEALEVARLAAQGEHVRMALVGADAILVTESLLRQANEHAANAVASLEAYAAGNGRNHLERATVSMDALLGTAARVPLSYTGKRKGAVTRMLNSYHEVVRQMTARLQSRVNVLEKRSTQLEFTTATAEQRLQNIDSRVDAVVGQFQSTFEAAQAQRQVAFDGANQSRLSAFEAQLTSQRARHDELVDQLRSSGTATAEIAKQDRVAALSELQDALSQVKADAKESLEAITTSAESDVAQVMAHLRGQRDVADQLVGLIGERGVTSSYQRTANEASGEMWLWQALTVVVLLALLGGAIFEFLPALKDGWNWGIGGARLMVAVIATLLASYAGTQAKIARDTLRRNRKREMDLSALEPYMASLPSDQQHALRNKIADRYFVEDQTAAVPASAVEDMLQDPDVVAALKGVPKSVFLAALKQLPK